MVDGLFLGYAHPVDVEPSAVVAYPWTGAEQTEFRSDPVSFLDVKRRTEIHKLFAVAAVGECSLSLVVGLLSGFLYAYTLDFGTEVYCSGIQIIGDFNRLSVDFLAALVGICASCLNQIYAVGTGFQCEGLRSCNRQL